MTFEIRFAAYGKRESLSLGRKSEGWTREKAEERLRHTLADVERGIWQPPAPEPVEAPTEVPTFHEFASEWLAAKESELKPKTITDYKWALELHLLPFFKDYRLTDIGVEDVDRYRAGKLKEGKLAPNAVNKTITRLAQVLEVAQEYGHIERNPAKGRRRRAKATKPKRSWVEVEQTLFLIEAADRFMRPLIATLIGAGLRIGEACALDWRDVNLGTGTIRVRESKTAAGEGREIDLPAGLLGELLDWKVRSPRTRPSDPVFVSGRPRDGKHGRQTERNAQARLKTVTKAANKKLAEAGMEQIGNCSPHSLRRSYASLRAALRDDPVFITEQMGHNDARFTFSVYQKAAKRREKLTGRYREAFDAACEWGRIGTRGDSEPSVPNLGSPAEHSQAAS
ncbi:MAG TPA: site-specific integrase [Solirubrobacterales bacterium]|nr:site-specific integrase [Solirubrobacterales bacterium]